MLGVMRRICRRAAENMNFQGQPGRSGADGWSLRWVSHNIKTHLKEPYCHRELVPKVHGPHKYIGIGHHFCSFCSLTTITDHTPSQHNTIIPHLVSFSTSAH